MSYRVLAALVLLPLIAGCGGVNETTFPSDLQLQSVRDGWAPLTSDEIEGRIVVLTFFSVECRGCDAALREIDQVYRHYATDEEVIVLLIAPGVEHGTSPDPSYVIVPYLNQHDLRVPTYWDRRALLARRFDFRNHFKTFEPNRRSGRPYVSPVLTLVLDTNGRIFHRQSGATQTAARVVEAIETIR